MLSDKGISLATTIHSSLLLEPELPAALLLRNWAYRHAANQEFLQLLPTEKNKATSSSVAAAMEADDAFEDLMTIASAVDKKRWYWVKACIKLTNLEQRFIYMASDRCNKSTGAEVDEIFHCNHC